MINILIGLLITGNKTFKISNSQKRFDHIAWFTGLKKQKLRTILLKQIFN
jgi:hypothetical protein